MEIFRIAQAAGASAVKLQKRSNRDLFTQDFYNSPYTSDSSYGATYGAHRDFLEFDRLQYRDLRDFAHDLGLDFFATPFDLPSVDFLEELDIPFYKIASASITNLVLLRYVAQTGKPMLISTGGASVDDISRAWQVVYDVRPTTNSADVALLQCTAAYPCPPELMNLRRITLLRRLFPDVVVGLSDHQNGISLAVAAFTLGARIFEKHLTFSRAAKGTDHGFSLEFDGFRKLVRDLHRVEVALGDGDQPFEEEEAPVRKMGQAVYPKEDLMEGTKLSSSNLVLKSPADGLEAWKYDKALGKTMKISIRAEEPMSSGDWE